jgi:nitrate/nitrite-specific signal transduction histidine kinase
VSRQLRAALIAGATATVSCFVWAAWPPTPQYVPIEICIACIGLSFMAAGIAAWQRWATSRLGLLFTELGSLIESASKEAREALTELRELARGIHPAVLTETGLAGAIQALVERSPVATTITAVPDGRFPAPIEATAYFVVSEALANVAKHARASAAEVTICTRPGRLVVEVSDDGPEAPARKPDRGCEAWPTGWPRSAACCG